MQKKDLKIIKTPPAQKQNKQPGKESIMIPEPIYDDPKYLGSKKLENKVALISGGDSGIGRAVAVSYAKEGADIAIVYFTERDDAMKTKELVRKYRRKCLVIPADLRKEKNAHKVVDKVINKYGKLDILVNNIAVQYPQKDLENINELQLKETFETNIYSYFYLTKASLPHLKKGSSIINTSSIVAFHGSEKLIDYSATKGAIVAFTKSLSASLIKKDIRVNDVAPGPIWTPLIPSSFDKKDVGKFGADTPMSRVGQPFEVAPAYVYLASNDSTYVTGQTLHVNGGTVI